MISAVVEIDCVVGVGVSVCGVKFSVEGYVEEEGRKRASGLFICFV